MQSEMVLVTVRNDASGLIPAEYVYCLNKILCIVIFPLDLQLVI
jgi:hypothetical protein